MNTLDEAAVDAAASERPFSGVVTIDVGDERVFEKTYGFAHRALQVPITPDMQFGLASGNKMFTALAVMRLVEEGHLLPAQRVRDILGDDLPLIDDAVTIEHLLTHTSGIGDYLDEEADWDVDDYILPVPVHTLTTAHAFLPVLDGFPQRATPGDGFTYCNGGYMVLAVVLERLTGEAHHDSVRRLVLDPAGLEHTGFLRLDELPAGAAVGYVYDHGDRANTLHLPALGNGDGGAFATASDLHRFWRAFFAGKIVAPATVEQMLLPRFEVPEEDARFGLGVWLHATGSAAFMEGYDAGVSMRSTHIPAAATTATVLGNSSEGAWPVIGVMEEWVAAELRQ